MQRKYRMYGLVPFNISPIQQAIQFGHAVVEYAQQHFNDEDYQSWATNDKTFIVLNGGTTNDNPLTKGTLNQHKMILSLQGIKNESFREPDLGNQLTAVVFLVDDRIWDKDLWPDYDGPMMQAERYGKKMIPSPIHYKKWEESFGEDHVTILWLRDYLRNFRKA